MFYLSLILLVMHVEIYFWESSKRRMMSLGAYNTITKCGDNRGTRECLLRQGHRQNMQVGSISNPENIMITLSLFQSYARGIDPSQHFKLLATRYLWLSIPTILTWSWRTNQTRSGPSPPPLTSDWAERDFSAYGTGLARGG